MRRQVLLREKSMLRPFKRLYLCLFVHAEHYGVVRRAHIQPDDVPQYFARLVMAYAGTHGKAARTSAGRVFRLFVARYVYHFVFYFFAYRRRPGLPRLVTQKRI
jgi:hypothetical protein